MANVWVRMKTQASGPDWSGAPGQIIHIPEKDAKALIDGGYAVPASDPRAKKIEEATAAPAAERAVAPEAERNVKGPAKKK